MKKKRISRLLAAGLMSALMALVALPQAALASVGFGPIEASGGGMSVTWWGVWENSNRMNDIDITLCDTAPDNSNEATAALMVALRNPSTGAISYQTPGARLKVPQYGGPCVINDPVWSLGYSPQQIWAVSVQFWGDGAPSNVWSTRWVYNPYL
ncbi:hypothetical protein [Micromonospora sp. NPDC023956]|uniref:hypothetical protein n=1 Tax=Micromonospora sp. NPDC023956 TaxID=3155722 RepID=UPI0033FD1D6D